MPTSARYRSTPIRMRTRSTHWSIAFWHAHAQIPQPNLNQPPLLCSPFRRMCRKYISAGSVTEVARPHAYSHHFHYGMYNSISVPFKSLREGSYQPQASICINTGLWLASISSTLNSAGNNKSEWSFCSEHSGVSYVLQHRIAYIEDISISHAGCLRRVQLKAIIIIFNLSLVWVKPSLS